MKRLLSVVALSACLTMGVQADAPKADVKKAETAKEASSTKGQSATVINLAGKQRMLTQKMTKELLLVANGIDADANKANAKKTGELFETTLKGLTDKCKNEDIKKQLGTVAKLWADYKAIIEKADTAEASLKKAEELNMPLLKEMNKAVKMFEASIK